MLSCTPMHVHPVAGTGLDISAFEVCSLSVQDDIGVCRGAQRYL